MTIKWKDGKVDRRQTHIRTITAREAVADYDALANALDETVKAMYVARWAMRQPLDDWKGVCERTAFDAIRDALRRIGAID